MADKYKPRPEYAAQKESRTVKFLMYSLLTAPGSLKPGEVMPNEVMFRQGQEIPLEQFDDYNLERGERLGAFYTDAELALATEPEAGQEEGKPAFDEMGEAELAEYIREHKPNEQDTVDMAGGNPELAARLLEAEHMATGGDPRAGVVKKLTSITEGK